MKAYLEKKKIYVQNDEKLVYKLESMEIYDGYDTLRLNLVLVCGWDVGSPEDAEFRGWRPAESFTEEVQDTQEICYIMQESIKECLEANGYEVLDECPYKEDVKKES